MSKPPRPNQSPNQTRVEIIDLVDDDELNIRWMPGESDSLILVFSGIQHGMGGLPLNEFAGTASSGQSNHVLFVSDMQRSWYSRPGLPDRIRETVMAFIETHGIRDIRSIGNSMGGYGAVLFSASLPVQRVAAFVPQVSMDLEQIAETRWSEFRAAFGSELAVSLADPVRASTAQIHIVFGAASRQDMAQAALLPEVPHLHVHLIRDWGHQAVKQLKDAGQLSPLVHAMLYEPAEAVTRKIAQANAPLQRLQMVAGWLGRKLRGQLKRRR